MGCRSSGHVGLTGKHNVSYVLDLAEPPVDAWHMQALQLRTPIASLPLELVDAKLRRLPVQLARACVPGKEG